VNWYRKGADGGDVAAIKQLGAAEARQWYAKAAKLEATRS
jgi:hypothetical protein